MKIEYEITIKQSSEYGRFGWDWTVVAFDDERRFLVKEGRASKKRRALRAAKSAARANYFDFHAEMPSPCTFTYNPERDR